MKDQTTVKIYTTIAGKKDPNYFQRPTIFNLVKEIMYWF